MDFFTIYGIVILAALLGGSLAGLGGFYIIGLRMPFLAVCMAHAAFAGAVLGQLADIPISLSGFGGALLGSFLLILLLRNKNAEPGGLLGVVFSVMLGLAFLGIGLNTGAHSKALGLMWGSILFVNSTQIIFMVLILIVFVAFVRRFNEELKVLLFSRELASLLYPEPLIMGILLVLLSSIITVNLQTVGGILLFSLLCNPAIAALQITGSFRAALLTSTAFGALCALGGFFTALVYDLPVGACIVLISSALVGICILFGKYKTQ